MQHAVSPYTALPLLLLALSSSMAIAQPAQGNASFILTATDLLSNGNPDSLFATHESSVDLLTVFRKVQNDQWNTVTESEYLEAMKAMWNLAGNMGKQYLVRFKTVPGPGATVRFETPFERSRGDPPRTANGKTDVAEAHLRLCTYYIWAERNGVATSDKNRLEEISEDVTITLDEGN